MLENKHFKQIVALFLSLAVAVLSNVLLKIVEYNDLSYWWFLALIPATLVVVLLLYFIFSGILGVVRLIASRLATFKYDNSVANLQRLINVFNNEVIPLVEKLCVCVEKYKNAPINSNLQTFELLNIRQTLYSILDIMIRYSEFQWSKILIQNGEDDYLDIKGHRVKKIEKLRCQNIIEILEEAASVHLKGISQIGCANCQYDERQIVNRIETIKTNIK